MLRLPDHWVWDSWLALDGDVHHLFFLRASRALIDPARRHDRASVGHATSRDLRRWELQPDALVHADSPAWDDMAIWTGSVVRGPAGEWRLFYTGRRRAERGAVQRIGAAVSEDLATWTRVDDRPLVEADPRWYEKLDLDRWPEEAWRDPYVVRDPDGDGWHMLITARAADGDPAGRGVIGHARSADLVEWEVQAPLTAPCGFRHLEVPRVAEIDGRAVLMFCCGADRLADGRRSEGGVWVASGASLLGPWDLQRAATLAHPSLYAPNFAQSAPGRWCVLGLRDVEDAGFVGEIADPLALEAHGDTVRLVESDGRRSTG
jgi:beta-fructofuranosidase